MDARFHRPEATLAVCWEAIRANDEDTLAECVAGPQESMPYPGMMWFLPPASRLGLYSVRVLPIADDRVLASYEVRFIVEGTEGEGSFTSTTELVRIRGEWRIVRLPGEASGPELRGVRRSVDS